MVMFHVAQPLDATHLRLDAAFLARLVRFGRLAEQHGVDARFARGQPVVHSPVRIDWTRNPAGFRNLPEFRCVDIASKTSIFA